ncbi:LOW QUALITY PROTEIN: hypothetical protein Cgig2_000266 [Carnegiea gigantea]|uniref:Aminotransferase-like plant mobile domain-containing protein n=1 Tax=Carnegiea gigantea TaxID=171969 RepID=A0A9Q1GJQ9_9CARY|nr:LOW QUALITY PROTEIN: hypothetical protein Cgig2_000266 [Carnegiea gigantea]
MEWTRWVLAGFEELLKQVGIFGAIGVSHFSYHFDANVWRAFCEFWGPLTNTFHHGHCWSGLEVYPLLELEVFLPLNKDLAEHNKYPAIVIKLLRIHAELCKFHNAGHIYYDLWLEYFYREYLVYFAYGEQTNSEKEKVKTKKRSPLRISRQE